MKKKQHSTAISLPRNEVTTDFAKARVIVDGSIATLFLDDAESSAIDLEDPLHLEFEYMQHIQIFTHAAFSQGSTIRALHLGAAGCALARALDAAYPGSRQLAIEIDATLAELVRQWFPLPRSPHLRIRADEARHALENSQAQWDVIIRDAFAQRQVPEHLTTVEFTHKVREKLRANGVYLVNSLAGQGKNQGSDIRALLEIFPYCNAIADPAVLHSKRWGNIVLAASMREINAAEIERNLRKLPLPARFLDDSALRERYGAAPLLHDAPHTCDGAPVEDKSS